MLPEYRMEVDNVERETLSNRLRTAYWSLVALGCGLLLSVRPVLAETIWDRFSSIMQDIYGQVVAISTRTSASPTITTRCMRTSLTSHPR